MFHSNLCAATYLATSMILIYVIVSTMWDSFATFPVGMTIRVNGMEVYTAAAAVGVHPSTTDQAFVAVVGDDAETASLLSAPIQSFDTVETTDEGVQLSNERGIVELFFETELALKNFFAHLDAACFGAQAGGPSSFPTSEESSSDEDLGDSHEELTALSASEIEGLGPADLGQTWFVVESAEETVEDVDVDDWQFLRW